jgi:TonB family protein
MFRKDPISCFFSCMLLTLAAGCTSTNIYKAQNLDHGPRALSGAYSESRATLRKQGIAGIAHLKLQIEADGSVSSVSILDTTNQAIADLVMTTAKGWKFSPPLKDGHPVTCTEILEFRSPLSPAPALADTNAATKVQITSLGFTEPFCALRSVDKAPVSIGDPRPIFPEADLRAGISGWATIAWIVERDGSVKEARVVSASEREFGEAGVEWALSLRYNPGMKGGAPVRVAMMLPVKFEIHAAGAH